MKGMVLLLGLCLLVGGSTVYGIMFPHGSTADRLVVLAIIIGSIITVAGMVLPDDEEVQE